MDVQNNIGISIYDSTGSCFWKSTNFSDCNLWEQNLKPWFPIIHIMNRNYGIRLNFCHLSILYWRHRTARVKSCISSYVLNDSFFKIIPSTNGMEWTLCFLVSTFYVMSKYLSALDNRRNTVVKDHPPTGFHVGLLVFPVMSLDSDSGFRYGHVPAAAAVRKSAARNITRKILIAIIIVLHTRILYASIENLRRSSHFARNVSLPPKVHASFIFYCYLVKCNFFRIDNTYSSSTLPNMLLWNTYTPSYYTNMIMIIFVF